MLGFKYWLGRYGVRTNIIPYSCLLYTSDAADDTPCVDLGGRRIIKKSVVAVSLKKFF
ncbi:hypothetical protein JMUB7528_28650 [Staphylococcus aureus]